MATFSGLNGIKVQEVWKRENLAYDVICHYFSYASKSGALYRKEIETSLSVFTCFATNIPDP